MCVRVYIYTHTYMYIYVHTYMYIFIIGVRTYRWCIWLVWIYIMHQEYGGCRRPLKTRCNPLSPHLRARLLHSTPRRQIPTSQASATRRNSSRMSSSDRATVYLRKENNTLALWERSFGKYCTCTLWEKRSLSHNLPISLHEGIRAGCPCLIVSMIYRAFSYSI